ncbi:ferredoxin [Streptomyces sp. NPDC000594]|uniref:ferredoxin n=1 Tax=Streptomyces sp. NPDC000594 TaxID=3154261 RepID=UPI003333C2C0
MELQVDRERCLGAGMCALTAPELFDQDGEDGLVLLLNGRPGAELHAVARESAWVCPAGAITVVDRARSRRGVPGGPGHRP